MWHDERWSALNPQWRQVRCRPPPPPRTPRSARTRPARRSGRTGRQQPGPARPVQHADHPATPGPGALDEEQRRVEPGPAGVPRLGRPRSTIGQPARSAWRDGASNGPTPAPRGWGTATRGTHGTPARRPARPPPSRACQVGGAPSQAPRRACRAPARRPALHGRSRRRPCATTVAPPAATAQSRAAGRRPPCPAKAQHAQRRAVPSGSGSARCRGPPPRVRGKASAPGGRRTTARSRVKASRATSSTTTGTGRPAGIRHPPGGGCTGHHLLGRRRAHERHPSARAQRHAAHPARSSSSADGPRPDTLGRAGARPPRRRGSPVGHGGDPAPPGGRAGRCAEVADVHLAAGRQEAVGHGVGPNSRSMAGTSGSTRTTKGAWEVAALSAGAEAASAGRSMPGSRGRAHRRRGPVEEAPVAVAPPRRAGRGRSRGSGGPRADLRASTRSVPLPGEAVAVVRSDRSDRRPRSAGRSAGAGRGPGDHAAGRGRKPRRTAA